ncbi:hypothetical protein EDC96DRAFT_527543, partial [Choanephora cucurbitarum]
MFCLRLISILVFFFPDWKYSWYVAGTITYLSSSSSFSFVFFASCQVNFAAYYISLAIFLFLRYT